VERDQLPIVATHIGGAAPLEVVSHAHDGRAFVRPVGGTTGAELARAEHQLGPKNSRNTSQPNDEGDVTLF